MAVAQSQSRGRSSVDENGESEGKEVPNLLRLLGAGCTGGILIALRDGPLRTRDLTTRVAGYAPRTLYRYASRLVEVGALEREEEPGVPSKVTHELTDPGGVELCELVEAYARTALEVLSDGRIVPHSWGSLTLLADLWESGMFAELNGGPCTMTELARVGHEFSFHQVTRRTHLYLVGGLIREANGGGRRRRYELTEETRQAAGLIAGLGRWRERHVSAAGTGLTPAETAELLQAALPLTALPDHAGECFELVVAPAGCDDTGEELVIGARVGRTGEVAASTGPVGEAGGRGRGKVEGWLQALVSGKAGRIRVSGGGGAVVKPSVQAMHEALWTRRDGRSQVDSGAEGSEDGG